MRGGDGDLARLDVGARDQLVDPDAEPEDPRDDPVDHAKVAADAASEKERLGYDLTLRLYREIYHRLDWDNPEESITKIQVEISSRGD